MTNLKEKIEKEIKKLERARAGLELAQAGRGLWLEKAKRANNANIALKYIRASTRPSDAFEARQLQDFQEANAALKSLKEQMK